MADDSNDTQAKIDEEDRDLQRKERQLDPSSQDRDGFADAGSGFVADTGAEGEFAHQGDSLDGETEGVTAAPSFGNPETGAGGAQAGATDRGGGGGSMSGTTGSMTSGSAGGQSAGSVGTVGSAGEDNEYGAHDSDEHRAEEEERSS